MNREVEYRVWVLDKMYYPTTFSFDKSYDGKTRIAFQPEDSGGGTVVSEDFMEFSGKIDTDKNKIFEDDFIKDPGGNIGLVEWNNDHAQFLVNFGSETQELLEVEKWGKVIGNKWQNPEWLKENKNVTN